MRVLVTGAAGFVGSRLAEVLLDGGYPVVGLDCMPDDDLARFREARLSGVLQHDRFEFVQQDITDGDRLASIVRQVRPQAVVALASTKDLVRCEEDPVACHRIHAQGAIQTMRACREANVGHLLLASSAHVYGGSRQYPLREDDPADRPLSQLGASFRAMELAAHSFALRSRVNVSIVRIFSVYGPRQSPSRFVPRLMAAAHKRQDMTLYGDGTFARDMIHVDDVVVGLLRILDRPAPHRILNLGTQESTTLGQVAEMVSAEFDVILKTRLMPARPGELPQAWADISAARAQVGFQPALDLAAGISQTVKWFRRSSSYPIDK